MTRFTHDGSMQCVDPDHKSFYAREERDIKVPKQENVPEELTHAENPID